MTLYVDEANLTVDFYLNLANQAILPQEMIITSQWSHQPLVLEATILESNDRYTKYQVTFPTGFGDEHKNGIYNYSIGETTALEPTHYGLVKIITEPGGTMGTVSYDAGPDAEERVADVFYRPNY